MKSRPYSHLTDECLLRTLRRAVADERTRTSEVVALIAEVEARRLYAAEGYESMYVYCVRELKLSREAALKRIRVGRLARRWPAIVPALADGRLNLSGLVMMSKTLKSHPGLGRELLNAIVGKTTLEIREYLAERFPQPDFPARIITLAPAASSPNGATEELSLKSVGAPEMTGPELSSRTVEPQFHQSAVESFERSSVVPWSAGKKRLEMLLTDTSSRKLEHLLTLVASQVPSGELEKVFELALDVAIAHFEKRKFAKTDQPRAPKPNDSDDPRHIPADVKRTVHERDGGQCTFTSPDGRRCDSKRVEYDHIQPVARGGESTQDNLRLRCRAHNQLSAEREFGSGFMQSKRETARARRANAAARALEARRAQEREDAAALARAFAERATPEQTRAHLDRVWALLDHAANPTPTTNLESSP